MDDKEYYTLMNRSSSWAVQQSLKKKKSSTSFDKKNGSPLPDNASTFTSLELRQGKADAEMLMEKKN